MSDRTHVQRMLRVAGDVAERSAATRDVNVAGLDRICRIDVAARVCVAEPGLTFRGLLEATARHGLAPCAMPRRRSVTLADAVVDCVVTSSTLGAFHESCLEYEIVTGIGDVVRCSRRHDAELFRLMHGSHGALGILTEITFTLVPLARVVEAEPLRMAAAVGASDRATYARLERRMDPEGRLGQRTLRCRRST